MVVFRKNIIAPLLAAMMALTAPANAEERPWTLTDDGIMLEARDKEIQPRKDHFAMSGRTVDLILEWEINEQGSFAAKQLIRWPMLRTAPNNTHASYSLRFEDSEGMSPLADGKPIASGKVERIVIDGMFHVHSDHGDGIKTVRHIFPASSGPAIIDLIKVENTSGKYVNLKIPQWRRYNKSGNTYRGTFVTEEYIIGEGAYSLAPGEKRSYAIVKSSHGEAEAPYFNSPEMEYAARKEFIREMKDSLVLDTPDKALNRMFLFCKIRATESIFSTRGGLMHGPGGYNTFLAAIWANDQAEYVNPFFPYLGNTLGNESAMNSFRWFAKYMNEDYKPIPSSIISEGEGYWNGAGDRGDAAMIAYGAARFALASGNEEWAAELSPLIEWCLEYTKRQLTPEGVAASKSDELEGRFPSGKANLCTNILYYDALLTSSHLFLESAPEKAAQYKNEAIALKTAIKKYFEGEVEGFKTYKYYEDNDKLRSWICMPLTAGIYDRAGETTNALLSPKLWFGHGMLTESGSKTYWDRSALYAFRGIFAAGLTDKGFPKFKDYSYERLMGQHVPYPIEAFPEAGQSHLSAESGLYCRIFIEGLFGITPTGLRSFTLCPQLPAEWSHASLKNIKAYGSTFSVELKKSGADIRVLVTNSKGDTLYQKTGKAGQEHKITLR